MEKKYVGFRIDVELWKKLVALAEKDRRSVSSLLNILVEQAVKDK